MARSKQEPTSKEKTFQRRRRKLTTTALGYKRRRRRRRARKTTSVTHHADADQYILQRLQIHSTASVVERFLNNHGAKSEEELLQYRPPRALK
jgi:hypothetical protein